MNYESILREATADLLCDLAALYIMLVNPCNAEIFCIHHGDQGVFSV